MNNSYQLTFYKSELNQYNFILKNPEIEKKISTFLLKYVSIEAFYKKLLVAEKESNGKKLTRKEKDNLGVDSREVKRVLSYFNINYDEDLVERIFGGCDDNYMDRHQDYRGKAQNGPYFYSSKSMDGNESYPFCFRLE